MTILLEKSLKYLSMRRYLLFGFILILSIIISSSFTGCNLLDSTDEVGCDPSFTCSIADSDKWTYLGLGSETILSIAVNPCNAGHILAGGRGIYRSTDCGESWEQVWESGMVTQIVYDPKNPDIVYANSRGMIRSMDGG